MLDKLLSIVDFLKKNPVITIAVIAAALASLIFPSCSAQAKVSRSGVHIDTVRVDYIVRSRTFTEF